MFDIKIGKHNDHLIEIKERNIVLKANLKKSEGNRRFYFIRNKKEEIPIDKRGDLNE